MSSARRTKHPAFGSTVDDEVRKLQESLDIGLGRKGQRLDSFVTFRDLKESGAFQVEDRGPGQVTIIPGPGGGAGDTGGFGPDPDDPPDFGTGDPTKPPRPTGVRARGLNLNTIGVSWNPPNYANHAYAEIFASFEDNWLEIRETFNESQAIGAGNQSQYFMGTAAGTTFLHRGLGDTIPIANFERDIQAVFSGPGEGQFTVRLGEPADPFVDVGDDVYLGSSADWGGNGIQGTVEAIDDLDIIIAGPSDWVSEPLPADAVISLVPEEDDLEVALNPRTIYYWVRFVSTAQVPGNVQSIAGVPGTVMLNPEEILNILTGRIRSSQLANDIVAPINFIRGPITQLDEDGNPLYPTIRDFVLAQGEGLISEYDEILQAVFLGYLGDGDFNVETWDIDGYRRQTNTIFQIASFDPPEELVVNDDIAIFAPPGTFLSPISAQPGEPRPLLTIINLTTHPDFPGATVFTVTSNVAQVTLPETPDGFVEIDDARFAGADVDFPIDHPGVAAAAALVQQIAGETSSQGAWIEALETLQAAFEEPTEDGLRQIISTIMSRRLVEATDDSALAYIADTMQVEFGEDLIALNDATQVIFANEESIVNAIQFRVQQNIGGILFSAGFGIGLEGAPGEEPESTFAVAADQFAIMAAANNGRVANRIRSVGSGAGRRYVIRVEAPTSDTSVTDGLQVGARVTVTVPFNSPQVMHDEVRGRVFEVTQRSGLQAPGDQFEITVKAAEGEPNLGPVPETELEPTHAVFPEQAIPFIVNTTVSPPVIGIRGRLIVEGMITATDIEVTDLLRANEVWAIGITAFGLIRTPALVGETIATPRFGGWAVKIATEDTGFDTRVIEFSRWEAGTDALPDPDDDLGYLDQAALYPHLNGTPPDDTAFWLKASDGSVYLRGNLTVGGNARFWTGYGAVGSDHFIQMDNEFPLFIMPIDEADAGGIPMEEGIGITYNNAIRNLIRGEALFWVNKDGTAGFNTRNNAIFVGDTPLEPPSGWGHVSVLNRLDDGAPTGLGRLWVAATFQFATNLFWPDSLVGCTFALFLASANKDYGGDPTTIIPTQRSGFQMPDGSSGPVVGNQATFMNTHWLIIRASSNTPGSFPDPGYNAFHQWQQDHPELIKITEHYNHASPGDRTIQGAIEAVASGNYKVLIVIVERYDLAGNEIWGINGPLTLPYIGNIFSQQISTIPYEGPTVANTGSDGSGGGGGGGGGAPPEPDPSPGPPIQQP